MPAISGAQDIISSSGGVNENKIGSNSSRLTEDEIGEFLEGGKNWHKTSLKKKYLQKFNKEMKGDINADFYVDNDTKEVLLPTNKSKRWVKTGEFYGK